MSMAKSNKAPSELHSADRGYNKVGNPDMVATGLRLGHRKLAAGKEEDEGEQKKNRLSSMPLRTPQATTATPNH